MDKNTLASNIQSLLDGLTESGKTPGAAIAVSSGDESLVVTSGVAAADTRTPFSSGSRLQIGCITKLLTALITLAAADSGQLDLDASIVDYLPELSEHPGVRQILLQHLLSHTSGYRGLNISDPETAYYYNWPKFVHFFAATEQLFPPGQVFNYEHSEDVILGEVLRRRLQIHCPLAFKERIFEPLGLCAGSVAQDAKTPDVLVADHRYDAAAGSFLRLKTVPYGEFWNASLSSLTLSLPDLVKIARALMADPANERLLRAAIHLPLSVGGSYREQLPQSFTLGCAQYRPGLFGHNGSARGQTCGLRLDVQHNIVVAVGLNAWLPFLRDTLLDYVFGKLTQLPADGADVPACHPPMNWPEFAGEYVGAQGIGARITLAGAQLSCCVRTAASQQQVTLKMLGDAGGSMRLASPSQHYTLGFFTAPRTQTPCLMLGLNAYKKASLTA